MDFFLCPLIAGVRADSARSVSLGCVADKAYPDGCMYHYWEFEGLFCKTPRTDQHVLPLRTVALPCFRPPLGPFMDWRSTKKKDVSSALKKTVTVRPTLRLCRHRVPVGYGVWQMFLPTEAWTLNPDDCMNEHPMRAVPALCVEGTPLDLPGVVSDPAGATGAPDPGAGPGLSFSPKPAFRRARQMSLGEVLRADKEDLSLRMTGGCTELGSLPHASSMNCISSTFPKSHSSFSTSRSFVGLFYEAPDDPSVHFTYSVSTMIATGGFSNVYLGLCHSTGELVCLKQPAHGYSEEHITAMEAEVATLRTLDHPNIVRYLGTDRTNIFTILLEYVPGGSVASLLELFGPLEESVLRHYLWQVLHGLRYLHDRDIIHRDIKGANLLVSDKGVVKLTDFGSSLSDTYGDDVRRMILGTVLWMAPEVCLEQGSALASDIWSLGCTVLQMATARTPWSERQFEHSIAAFYHIATCDSPPKIPRRVPGPVRQFVLQCLALRPAARPTCAQLMRHAMFTEHGAAAAQPTIPVTEDEDFSPRWCHMRKRHSIGTSCSESPRPGGGLSSDLNL